MFVPVCAEICPPVPVNMTAPPEVTPLAGPVVIPVPLPASALLLVIVVAEPAMATCPVVMPDIAEVAFDVQLVQVPVRLVIVPEVGVPRTGVVRLMLVAVVPLGSCSVPVELVLMVEVPLLEPPNTIDPAVPAAPSDSAPLDSVAWVS